MAGITDDPVSTGREGGKKSGEVRRRKAQLRKDLRARQAFVDAAEEVADELLKAARGQPPYDALDAKERVAVLKMCLEYGVGRPRAQDPMATDDPEEAQSGISFGTRGPHETDSAEPGKPGDVRPQPAQG